MRDSIDKERLIEAFTLLGEDLRDRGLFIEIAVYGGSAIMMQFAWRRATEDVDAVVREGYDEESLRPSVLSVARRLSLSDDWLNDAVGMFTPIVEKGDFFEACGSYPEGETPGLRVVLANPSYLLALKLSALKSLDRGDRDLADARRLARELGLASVGQLSALYESIFGETPPDDVAARLRSVVAVESQG